MSSLTHTSPAATSLARGTHEDMPTSPSHTISSSGEILVVTFSRPSLSEPCSYRQRIYSLGVFSRWFSMWKKACCATYATRAFGCFHTSPTSLPSAPFLSGCSSPVSSLIIVDLPAPLAPMQAARVESETRTVTLLSCALGAPG